MRKRPSAPALPVAKPEELLLSHGKRAACCSGDKTIDEGRDAYQRHVRTATEKTDDTKLGEHRCEEDVNDYLGTITKSVIRTLMAKSVSAVKKDEPRMWRAVDSEIDKLAGRGLTGYDILNEIIRYTSEDEKMPTKLRNRIFSLIGDALHWVSVSQDDMLAVKAFLRRFALE